MEPPQVRLPRYRTSDNLHHDNNNSARAAFQRYTFPNITPTVAPSSQRRGSLQYNSQQFQQQLHQRRSSQAVGNSLSLPPKPVYALKCEDCSTPVCARGMRAILLADQSVELYSTDTPSQEIYVLEKDYLTRSCHCRIRDVACLECGNIIGYHVVSPCAQCLDSCNNGHFWMFHSKACTVSERYDDNNQTLLWNNLPRAEMDLEFVMGSKSRYEQFCR